MDLSSSLRMCGLHQRVVDVKAVRVCTMNLLATSILFLSGTRAHRFWAASDLSMMSLSSAWEGYVRDTSDC